MPATCAYFSLHGVHCVVPMGCVTPIRSSEICVACSDTVVGVGGHCRGFLNAIDSASLRSCCSFLHSGFAFYYNSDATVAGTGVTSAFVEKQVLATSPDESSHMHVTIPPVALFRARLEVHGEQNAGVPTPSIETRPRQAHDTAGRDPRPTGTRSTSSSVEATGGTWLSTARCGTVFYSHRTTQGHKTNTTFDQTPDEKTQP